jgi:hypothetical protein
VRDRFYEILHNEYKIPRAHIESIQDERKYFQCDYSLLFLLTFKDSNIDEWIPKIVGKRGFHFEETLVNDTEEKTENAEEKKENTQETTEEEPKTIKVKYTVDIEKYPSDIEFVLMSALKMQMEEEKPKEKTENKLEDTKI